MAPIRGSFGREMTTTVTPIRPDGRIGTSNARRKVGTTDRAPWASWRGSEAGRRIRFVQSQVIVPKGFGAGRPMRLLRFQREWIEEAYAEGIRSAALAISRGNGKTGLLAALALAELHLDSWSPDVPVIAPTIGVSIRPSGVFGTMRRMTALNPALAERTLVYNSPSNTKLDVPANDGTAYPVSSRDEGAMQGLALSLGIADELAHLDAEAWSSLTLAGGKRSRSLVAGISTPGSKTSALWALRKAVHGGATLPGFSWTEYKAPDGCALDDRKAWKAANPALGTYLSADSIVSDLGTVPEWAFRMYRLGQWVDASGDGWLGERGPQMWQALADTEYRLVRGEPTWVGVDVSLRGDSTAVVAIQERTDALGWYASSRIWYPGSGTVDQAFVKDHIRSLARDYNVIGCAYDPRFWVASAQDLEHEEITMIEVPQTAPRMVPAISTLYKAIVDGLFWHDGSPDFASQILGAAPRPSEGGITLSKLRSDVHIDAAIAAALAISLTGAEPEQPLDDDALKVFT